jgi:hypothetical protein
MSRPRSLFPLPELSLTKKYFSPLNIPLEKEPNFIGFRVWIDDREIKPEREVRAFLKGEITADLKRLGLDPLYIPISTSQMSWRRSGGLMSLSTATLTGK